MKVVILSKINNDPHAGWLPVDEYARRLASHLDAPIFCPTPPPLTPLPARIPPRFANLFKSNAPDGDVLLVIARSSGDLEQIRKIKRVRSRFERIYAWVADSYFKEGYTDATRLYDKIAVTDEADAAWIQARYGVQSVTVRQGVDTLAAMPQKSTIRSIDIMGFGRTPVKFHAALQQRFHRADQPYLYLHSPLGNLTGPTIETERHMLLKALQRSRFSLAFNMYCNPEMNRPKSMMVTTRWLESLAAGCVVVGKRPISQMADEMLFWPDCTTEVPDDPSDAADFMFELCQKDESEFAQIRQRNVFNMAKNHDIRSRMVDLLTIFQIDIPAALHKDIEEVGFHAAKFQNMLTT